MHDCFEEDHAVAMVAIIVMIRFTRSVPTIGWLGQAKFYPKPKQQSFSVRKIINAASDNNGELARKRR